jgi:outer membrane receptor protein involved in Fe transport
VVNNGTTILPVGSKDDWDTTNTNLTVRETHSFTQRAISQLTLTFAHYEFGRSFSFPGASGILPADVGFSGVHPQSSRFPTLPSVNIALSGISIADGSANETAKTTWQIKEDVSLAKLNGILKFGAEARGFKQQSITESDNGHFLFSSVYTNNFISDFLVGKPFNFTQTSGSSIYPRQRSYYFYAADDWRLKPNLTLNLGVRYEFAPPLTDKLDQVTAFRPGESSERFPDAPVGLLFAGDPDPVLGRVPRGVYPADKNNLAPRIGLAYSPKPESGLLRFIFGDGKSALRAGGGIFYDQTVGNSFTRFSFVQPFSVKQSVLFDQIRSKGGSFANPFGSLVNPWPIDLSERAFTGTPDTTRTLDPRFRTAQTYQYNLTLQRELRWSLLMELAYVGSTSLKLNRARELNIASVSEAPGKAPPRHRPYSSLGSVLSQESSGRAHYDSLQVRIVRRPAKGLTFDGSYVLGKSLDNGSSPDQLAGPDQLRWARSSFDRRHNIVVSYGYDLPLTHLQGWRGGVLSGWQLGGITEFRTGMPIDIVQFPVGTGISGLIPYRVPDFVGPYKRLNPRKSQTLVVNGNAQTGNFYFDPGAFRQAGVDYTQPGTLGRNVFSGPGINLWSLSIIKRIRITESQHFSLRSDIRNLFNRAHFENPTTPLPNSTFGQVPGAGPGRNVQLSLKYTF